MRHFCCYTNKKMSEFLVKNAFLCLICCKDINHGIWESGHNETTNFCQLFQSRKLSIYRTS